MKCWKILNNIIDFLNFDASISNIYFISQDANVTTEVPYDVDRMITDGINQNHEKITRHRVSSEQQYYVAYFIFDVLVI